MKKIIMLMVVLFGTTGGAWGGMNVAANYTASHDASNISYLDDGDLLFSGGAGYENAKKPKKMIEGYSVGEAI